MPQDSLLPFMMVFTGVAALFLFLWLVVSMILGRRQEDLKRRIGKDESDASLTLVQLPPTTLRGKMDSAFARMVDRTGLDMDTTMALGIMVLFGVIAAGAAFIWRGDEQIWLTLPAFVLGCLIPLGFFIYRQRV